MITEQPIGLKEEFLIFRAFIESKKTTQIIHALPELLLKLLKTLSTANCILCYIMMVEVKTSSPLFVILNTYAPAGSPDIDMVRFASLIT